jgi:hypothetical protein
VLRESVGEVGRPPTLGSGGGVSESARGLPKTEGDGEMAGEMAGDDASGGCRHPKMGNDVSSSDMAYGSSSLSRDDTKGGSTLDTPFDMPFDTPFGAPFVVPFDVPFDTPFSVPFLGSPFVALRVEGPATAGDDTELEPSPL